MQNIITRKGTKETISAVHHTTSLIRNSDVYRNLTAEARAFIDDQLFGSRTIDRNTPMSALRARIHHDQCLQHTVQLAFSDLLGNFPLPIFATFSFLEGEVPMGASLRHSQTIISAIAEGLRKHCLEGVLLPDIDLLLLPDSEEPIVAHHWHGVFTPVGRDVRLKRVAQKMASQIGKPSRLEKSVKLGGKRPGDRRVHAENMGTYSTKYVSAVKDATGSRPQRGRDKFLPRHAIYGLYAWSQLPLLESVIPVGAFGETIHSLWAKRVRKARDPRARDVRFTRSELKRGWADVLSQIASYAP